MRVALALLLGRPIPRAEFQGTPGERAVYETACNLWRSAGYAIRSQKTTTPTLGARVMRSRGWRSAAAILLPITLISSILEGPPVKRTDPRNPPVSFDCPIEQKDNYGMCIPPQPKPPCSYKNTDGKSFPGCVPDVTKDVRK